MRKQKRTIRIKDALCKVSLVLLAVLFFASTIPKDFLHCFTGHTDTLHTFAHDHQEDGRVHLEAEHHHCSFLQDVLPPFLAAALQDPLVFVAAVVYETSGSACVMRLCARGLPSALLRGPPVA